MRQCDPDLQPEHADTGRSWQEEDPYQPFYGERQFSVRDSDGCDLILYQSA